MKNLTYNEQRKIEGIIEKLIVELAEDCRGRVEIGENVIEFWGENGKWKRTSWFHKSHDNQYSGFEEFKNREKIKQLVAVISDKDF